MIRSGVMRPFISQDWKQMLWPGLKNLTIQFKSQYLVEELWGVYCRYNQIQASGESQALVSISTGKALNDARKVTAAVKKGTKMEWQVTRRYKPILINARVGMLDLEGIKKIAQVVLLLESDQSLTTTIDGRKTKQEKHVTEYWMFERNIPIREGWKVKVRMDPPV
ncbi:hypothetical protein TREMEDRAFT_56173 [Tremella mesenterica DSM 1558]|uniref:uncharacterized protein n=1 Tax=Tremella mesenterica (strain ATCC 24925 / CBS 8224 / DSM 1558 / NBRC 9311 / NRRL Y-6157 / RJB 2259-6 / UBC 559-6) TaxID=578456 RepID=UPI0003F48D9F|nr:uncharacterized protein TREMEDRAFT_56173 [Tremella mesenterica DSM 1558]EIW73302.1 hypothetical protein TREMEDRAFT_56173 [Tremella mesenterica DSM 1558]